MQEASAPDARTQAGAALLEVGVQQLQTPAMWTLLGRHLHAAMDSLQAAPGPSDTTSAAKARRKAARRLAGQLAGVAQRALEAGAALYIPLGACSLLICMRIVAQDMSGVSCRQELVRMAAADGRAVQARYLQTCWSYGWMLSWPGGGQRQPCKPARQPVRLCPRTLRSGPSR